jgi:hypothetical protein
MTHDQALKILELNAAAKVSAVAQSCGPTHQALLAVAGDYRPPTHTWTFVEWHALLRTLDECELTIGEWLQVRDLL